MPARVDRKLIFALCNTCCTEKQIQCKHSDEQQMLTGMWTSIEVQKAVSQGYKIVKLYEIYNYKERGKLLDEDICTDFKIKQESSGLPKECLDKAGNVVESLLEQFICNYEQVKGIWSVHALQTVAKAL